MTRRSWLATMGALAAPTRAAGIETEDLWRAGSDGYSIFRIPGLVVTARGSTLAYCEARRSERGDWGAIDIVLRRRAAGEANWSPSRVIASVEGPKPKNPVGVAQSLAVEGETTYNNPVAIADRNGDAHFIFCLEYMRAFSMRSRDDGASWSPAVEITAVFDEFRPDYDWRVIATGPGHGVQLRSGRLVVPVWLSTGAGGHAHRPSVTATIYSDDGGELWRRGDIAIPNTEEWINPSEAAVAELSDGRVMLNARSESPPNRRLITISPDGATGWSRPEFHEELWEPVCMAGMVRYAGAEGGADDALLFSNPRNLDRRDGNARPGGGRDRRNLTLHLSRDDGRTWPARQTIEPGWSGYSDVAVARDGSILVLYERGAIGRDAFRVEAITLARIAFASLVEDR